MYCKEHKWGSMISFLQAIIWPWVHFMTSFIIIMLCLKNNSNKSLFKTSRWGPFPRWRDSFSLRLGVGNASWWSYWYIFAIVFYSQTWCYVEVPRESLWFQKPSCTELYTCTEWYNSLFCYVSKNQFLILKTHFVAWSCRGTKSLN